MLFSYIDIFIQLLSLAIFIRVILSWFTFNQSNFFTNFIYELTEPMLIPFRRFAIIGAFDLSPIVVIILLEVIRELLRRFVF
jgi:YggT family protein